MNFTHSEKCDMLEVYISSSKNTTRAQQQYQQLYPERIAPNRRYFLGLYRKFRMNEATFSTKRTKNDFIISEDTEITVLAYFQANPNNSISDLSNEMNLSVCNFTAYKYQRVQTLLPRDMERRLNFCRWFTVASEANQNHFKHILWSDESNFSNHGMVNKKNEHYWSRDNPLIVRPSLPQNKFSLNVWCGIINSEIVGPIFYEGSLTGERYITMVANFLYDFLDNMNLLDRQRIYFQQDGAPAHNYHQTQAIMNRLFGDQWIGTNGPVQWPPRSPDLTPMDFFLWGYIKNAVYSRKCANVQELQDHIFNVIMSIERRTTLRATRSVRKRIHKCIEQEGNVFEHLL